jgi:Putative zinc-finger
MKKKSSNIAKGKQISHKKAKMLFWPYLDGELDSKRKIALHDHLAGCEACREALKQEKTLFSGIANSLKTVEIPEKYNLVDSVAKEIKSLEVESRNEGSVLGLLEKLFLSKDQAKPRPSFSASLSYSFAIIVGISIGLLSGMLTPDASNTANYIEPDSSTTTSYLDNMIESVSYSDEESLTNLYFGTETEDTNE